MTTCIKSISLDYIQIVIKDKLEVDSCSLRCAVFNLIDAFNNYFSKHSNYPRFKSRFNKQSYRTTCIRSTYKNREYSNIKLDLVNRRVKLPKLGLVDIRGYRNQKRNKRKNYKCNYWKTTTNKLSTAATLHEFKPMENRGYSIYEVET